MAYPSTKTTFTDPSGTTRVDTGVDHAALHTSINDTIEAIEDTVGTTAGTSVLKNFAAGDFAARINSGGTLQQSLSLGTFTNPTITGGTLTTPVIASFYQDAGQTKLMSAPNTASDTLAAIAAAQTLTNKRLTRRVGTAASSGTIEIDSDSYDMYIITAQAVAGSIAPPTGTPTQGQALIIRFLDNGTASALTWNTIFRASSDLDLPTTTTVSKTLYCGFLYNLTDTKWDLLAKLDNF